MDASSPLLTRQYPTGWLVTRQQPWLQQPRAEAARIARDRAPADRGNISYRNSGYRWAGQPRFRGQGDFPQVSAKSKTAGDSAAETSAEDGIGEGCGGCAGVG